MGAVMSIKDPTFLQDMQGEPVDPGQLELLGKEAASLSETSALSLSEAVVQTIGKTKLNSQQVRRVVEFANHTAFDRKYASMDPAMRVVDIEGGPADPAQVLQDLNDGARPEYTAIQSLDYVMPPPGEKAASMDFGLGTIHEDNTALRGKTFGEISTLRHKLSAAHEELTGQAGSAQFQMTNALYQLQESVRLAVKTAGLTQEELWNAWSPINADVAESALSRMGPLPTRAPGVKVARRINPDHPVIRDFKTFEGFAQKYAQAILATRGLEQQLVKVEEFISQHRV